MVLEKSIKLDNIIHEFGLYRQEMVVLLPFVKFPMRGFSTSEIKALTGIRSHHYVFSALKRFRDMGIITETKAGKTNMYALDPSSVDVHYLCSVEYLVRENRDDVPYKNIRKICDGLKSLFYTVLIGGSYADRTQTAQSDIDIAIIIPDSEKKSEYVAALKAGELIAPEVHGFVFTRSEFVAMLVNEEFNIGKELVRKHIIYLGAESYYKMLFEAMRYGFKG